MRSGYVTECPRGGHNLIILVVARSGTEREVSELVCLTWGGLGRVDTHVRVVVCVGLPMGVVPAGRSSPLFVQLHRGDRGSRG